MPDPTTETETLEAEPEAVSPDAVGLAAEKAKSALDAIRALFDQLDPPETILVHDSFGGEYTLRSQIPARAQMRVVRHLERIASEDAGEELRAAMASRAGIQAVVLAVVHAAAQEPILVALAQAFEAAHPKVVEAARDRAKREGVDAKDAADLFGAEEMAAGLVPFLLGLLHRLVSLVGNMLKPAEASLPN